ncbi:MAG: hypothetical protein OEU76_05655, partial [Cyclobacteriaceae bacterium]|nr:hypothetical protein [Cyclobacteriaceae bacterium]
DLVKTAQGEVLSVLTMDGYREAKGVKFPERINQQQGPMSLAFELVDIQVNPTLEETVFK